MLAKPELFSRLAEGHAAGITVVTPNARLSQALQRDFDVFQSKKTSWEAPDILPYGAFVQRLYEDALYSDAAPDLPLLLTPAQEQWLWQEVVSNSGLLAIADTAERCRKAWKLVHEWRIPKGQGNEDAAAFSVWSSFYREKTASEVDAARLPDLVLTLLDRVRKPKLLVAYGFDILPPQTKQFFAAFESEQCQPEPKSGSVTRGAFASAKEELENAAAWARARLEQHAKGVRANESLAPTPLAVRIGIVVPGLEQRRREVGRIFARAMQPGAHLPGAAKAAAPFNVSLGFPLSGYPVVAAALDLIELALRELPFERVSELVRSPFIGGALAEEAARARLDARLRRKLGATVGLPKLIGSTEGGLRALLEAVFALKEAKSQTASAWARHFSALLDAAGFPGERGLDSDEFQARAKLHEVLGELSQLERISPAMSFSDAFRVLKRACAETLFQPESPDAPVQVLGVLESAGIGFDHLWVSGLTEEAWPLRASANAFIPIKLQKDAGIPEAGADSSLALDQRITDGWARAAGEVVFSSYLKEDDRDVAPSTLIASIPEGKVEVPPFAVLRDLIFASKKISTVKDSAGIPVTATKVKGGTRVLSDQAACPFRAFAHHRLAAEGLESPADGLDASDRGRLVHELMAFLWKELKGSEGLKGDPGPAIGRAAAHAVKELELEGPFAELERKRLERLARDWLELEKARAPFEIAALEQKRTLRVGPLELDGRIDRMDKVAEGHVLIDYKTSKNASAKQWDGARPSDPQLPVYAVCAEEGIAAVTFAKVRPGEFKFAGYSKEKNMLQGVKPPRDGWQKVLQDWKAETESLGHAFAAGAAGVDPKRGIAVTCRYCDLKTLCRVNEKLNVLAEDEPEEEE